MNVSGEVVGSGRFKDTEIGTIPVEWKVGSLGSVASLNMGQSPPSSTYNTVGEGKFFLQGKAECGAVYPTPTKWCSEPKKLAKEGSVLISVRAPVGNVNIAREAYCIGRGLAAINGRDSLDNWFLFYLLIFAKQRLEQKSTGSTFKSINKGVLRDFLIPLPPLPEQRRIAHVLSTIQEAIAAQEDLIAAARETKRSLMQRLFTYGPGVEPAATKETEFGQVPKPWKITLLEEIAFVQTGAAKGRNLGESRVMAVPYLRVANVQDGYLDLSEIKEMQVRVSELDRYRLQPGDVVLTEGGDFDKLGRGFIWSGQIPDCVHQNHIFAVRMNREILLPEYFAYLVQSDYAKGYFLSVAHRTTHLACINKTKLQSLPVLVPSLDEQGGVVSILNAADQKISTEEQRKAALEELFRSMLHQLMTGQVRVPASLEVRP